MVRRENQMWTPQDVFGFHGGVLDIRQNSAFHDRALIQILERAGLVEAKSFAVQSRDSGCGRHWNFVTAKNSPRTGG